MTELAFHFNIEIDNFEDFATTLFTFVDDLYIKVVPNQVRNRKNIDQAKMSDSEIITLSLLGELLGCDSEKAWYSFVSKNYRQLFPTLCDRTRINRTRRSLMSVIKAIRKELCTQHDTLIIDSFPLPVCKFGRANFSKCFKGLQADYGYCASKKETYFGYKIHALCTLDGDIVEYLITSASVDDRVPVAEMLEKVPFCKVLIGDKGYTGETFIQQIYQETGVEIIALKKKTAKDQLPKSRRQLIFKIRRRIETTFSQFSKQFNGEKVVAKTLLGMFARIETKLLGLSCCFAFNRILGKKSVAKIKELIF